MLPSKPHHALRNQALLHISFGLGLRVKEIAALKIRDVLDRQGHLKEVVHLKRSMTKGQQARDVYLTNPQVRTILANYLAARREQDGITFGYGAALFRSQKGSHFSPNALQQLFQHLFQQAGIEGASSHSGRRTFATRLIERGVDIKAVSTLMGHRSIAMTAQYVEDNPERLKAISAEVF